jgi:hypothetical protein
MGYIADLRKTVGKRLLVMVGASVILLDKNNRILLQLRNIMPAGDCRGIHWN